jgi:hypothetical protein
LLARAGGSKAGGSAKEGGSVEWPPFVSAGKKEASGRKSAAAAAGKEAGGGVGRAKYPRNAARSTRNLLHQRQPANLKKKTAFTFFVHDAVVVATPPWWPAMFCFLLL